MTVQKIDNKDFLDRLIEITKDYKIISENEVKERSYYQDESEIYTTIASDCFASWNLHKLRKIVEDDFFNKLKEYLDRNKGSTLVWRKEPNLRISIQEKFNLNPIQNEDNIFIYKATGSIAVEMIICRLFVK